MYYFTYDYGNGDQYYGYTFASDIDYEVGAIYDYYSGNNQAGFNGTYTITGQISGYDSSVLSSLGQVVVYAYYDANTSGNLYTPVAYSQGLSSGINYLGSESDYLVTATNELDLFGYDYYEADDLLG